MSGAIATPRLGDWLLEQGHLDQAQLELALREQKRGGRLLGEALLDLGFVSQEVLSQFLARKTRTDSVDVARIPVAPEVLALVGEPMARALQALPIRREGDTLTVAVADPLDVTVFDRLERATGLRVVLVSAAEGELVAAIERLYGTGQSVSQIVDELLRLEGGGVAASETDAPTIRLADRILAEAISDGASDVHVHPEEKVLRVRFRRDGVLDSGYLLPKSVQPGLTARLKILGGMDIAEGRRTQGGRGTVTVAGREVALRFSSLPTNFGESLVVRVLDRRTSSLSLDALGFTPQIEARFRALLELPHGLVLVTGPTGSGKTTSLYTALSHIDGAAKSIFTLEDPVEFQLPLVRQTQVNEAIGLTFAEGLRTLLRQDPDVILVGETRDTETAQLMIRAALTGHLVFSTLHTNDALGAIPRLLDLGVPRYLLAPTLGGVLSQRLVRRLCPRCAVPAPEAEPVLEALGLQRVVVPGGSLRRAVGCPHCHGTGYAGRIGIHELLVCDAGIVTAVAAGADSTVLQERARATGFRTLLEDGVTKALQGFTTLDEVLRASGG